MLPPHLVTFPRSGSHYFAKLVHESTMFNIQRSHSINISFDSDNKKTKTIVTIARDPEDTIKSMIALQRIQQLDTSDARINEMITNYIMFYNFLFHEADYVIDFNDLVSMPDTVIKTVLDLLGIDKTSHIKFPDNTDYNAQGLARGSSKVIPGYENISLDKFSLNLCYLYYNKLLSRAIKFDDM